MDNGLLFAISLVIILIGLIGTVIPFVPGIELAWGGAVVYFIGSGVNGINIAFFTVITLVALLGLVFSILLPGQRTRAAGAAWSSVGLGFVGAIIGAIAFPVLGAIPGGIVGVYLGERLTNSDHQGAWDATMATIRGMGWAFIVQFTASIAVLATFVIWAITADQLA